MSVAPSEALERSVLEGKDREQLLAIAAALGVKPAARAKKADIIDKILEQVGVPAGGGGPSAEAAAPAARKPARARAVREADAPEVEPVELDFGAKASAVDEAAADGAPPATASAPAASSAPAAPVVVLGPDGEPLAEWELELAANGDASSDDGGDDDGDGDDDDASAGGPPGAAGEAREGRRRRRRRNRNRGADGELVPQPAGSPAAAAEPARPLPSERHERAEEPRVEGDYAANEPVAVGGYVDLREEGFGFLRVRGYLATKDDIYVSVKQVRQYGLRKGDHVEGASRAAGRNEKNPALLTITAINGADPDRARGRRRFEDLTPLFPDTVLRLESADESADSTARIIDLICPIGKGQRGLIVSPPKAGRTTIITSIAAALERNSPDVTVIVLLVDERPEEVTDMRRAVRGEVIASTFDGKPGEHTQVAEMAIEKAKRLVEAGDDVVMIVDGLTRLARAYNLAAPTSGKVLAGGIDAGALHPTKKFFGAARNLEEGGSLTILATVLVDTNSKVDEAIFDEFKGSANMELWLDRHLAERRVFPAIDVDASSTRHEERLFDRAELPLVRKLRRALSAPAAEGSASAIELLSDGLAAFPTNAALLADVAGQPDV